jgi:hypothetical protein
MFVNSPYVFRYTGTEIYRDEENEICAEIFDFIYSHADKTAKLSGP